MSRDQKGSRDRDLYVDVFKRRLLTVGGGVAQNLCNVLVGGVLAQSAHDVSNLVEGHLAVTDSVKETESLLEVWSGKGRETRENFLSRRGLTQRHANISRIPSDLSFVLESICCRRCRILSSLRPANRERQLYPGRVGRRPPPEQRLAISTNPTNGPAQSDLF